MLLNTDAPEAVSPLLNALKDKNRKVREATAMALHNLEGSAIDKLCSLWAESRDPELESIILKAWYVASRPLLLNALTTFLKGERFEKNLTKEILDVCLLDSDSRIFQGAIKCVMEQKGYMRHEILWAFAKDHPESMIPQVLHEKKWRPDKAAERALFYFLANDLDAYHDIDFEQSYLSIWYESSGEALQDAIASRIRESGDTRLLAVFRTKCESRKQTFSSEEVGLQIEILAKSGNHQELFHLLFHASYEQGMHIINHLTNAGWLHPDLHCRELQERLEKLAALDEGRKENIPVSYAQAIYQDFRPMFLGNEQPPENEVDMLAWASDKDNFRRRSAAVILLAEQNSVWLGDVANKASRDDYWQVRMAVAAAEYLCPGILSPANKALLEDDHTYWVQALFKLPHADRLADLLPRELEELKGMVFYEDQRPEGADDFFALIKGFLPAAERDYLLNLGEFFGTEVMVSEETAYEAGETYVEIDWE